MAIWKSDWSRKGTTVFFKCGNYFDDHGHFDQGHLDVFRQESLLLDSGAYLTFDGPYRKDYWRKSVAHNTLLVVDPSIENDEGGQRVFHSQSDETMADYLADTLAETGEILDYRIEKDLAYAAGDLTKAYPVDRVRRLTREIVFLADRFLVVVDRLAVTHAGLIPKVLWHCPVIPEISVRTGTFKIQRKESRAILSTLWPPDARLEWIEGPRVGGRLIPPEGHQKGFPDMGAGRIEVSAAPDRLEYQFIHTIDIADNADIPLPCTLKVEEDRIQVRAGSFEVSLKKTGAGLVH